MKIAEATKAEINSERHWYRNRKIQLLASVACVLFIAFAFIGFNGGIQVGFTNHTGLIPVVRRILDANYLPNDFNIKLRLYHHRTFAYFVAGFTRFLGEDNALIVLSIIGNLLLSYSLFYLCRALKLSLLAFIAIGLWVALNVAFTGHGLEINTFVGNREIQPTTFSHAFVLLSFAELLKERLKRAAFFTGVALLCHLQIGVTFALVLLPFYISRLRSLKKEILICAALFLLPVIFTLPDISQMMNRGLMKLPFTRADIDFRQPHHFELASVQAALWVTAYLIIQLLVWLWFRHTRNPQKRDAFVLFSSSLLITVFSLIHFADYYLIQSNRISKFQLVRLSCLITVFGIISLVFLINHVTKTRQAMVVSNLGVITLSLLFYFIPATHQGNSYSFSVQKYAQQKSAWVDVCLWVKRNLPNNTTFLTPPGDDGFTYLASRSNIGDFKTNPDGPQYLAEWYERLRDLAGGTLPNAKGFANLSPLNKSYAALSGDQLSNLANKYNAEYAVIPIGSDVQFETIYENRGYKVVNLTRETQTRAYSWRLRKTSV